MTCLRVDCRCLFPARDYEASSPGPYLSDKQLQDVAKTLGQEWEQAAIHLGLKNEDLDEIKNEEIAEFMRKYKMLQRWKSRRPQGKTTAQELLRGLEDLEDVPVKTRRLLTGNVFHPHTHRGGTGGILDVVP